MTIQTETRKTGLFVGDGQQRHFPFHFKVFTASDVLVVIRGATAERILVPGSDCTVTLQADQEDAPGGEVVLDEPLAAGEFMIIGSAVPNLQLSHFTNQGGFYPTVLNDALDRLTVMVQQLQERVGRSLSFAITSGQVQGELPPPAPNRSIGWNADGSMLTNTDHHLQAATAAAAALAQSFVVGPASLTEAGIVRLSSSTNSTDETMAATPKAVREAMLAAQSAVSSGAVAFFAGNTAPAGWLKANGAAVSRTTYAPLFAAIGTTYGAGNGSTTFNLPDLRGEFVRGWDDGRGIDGGRELGSWQIGTFTAADCQSSSAATYAPLGRNDTLNHLTYNEKMGVDNINNSDYPGVYGVVGTSRSNMFTKQGWNAGSIGSTRPRNVALLACIKI